MTKDEILMRYERAVKTQKRRSIIRLVMSGVLIGTAFLNYFNLLFFTDARALFYVLLLGFFIYSYAIGRRTGAAKDFKAIADYYMENDEAISQKPKNKQGATL